MSVVKLASIMPDWILNCRKGTVRVCQSGGLVSLIVSGKLHLRAFAKMSRRDSASLYRIYLYSSSLQYFYALTESTASMVTASIFVKQGSFAILNKLRQTRCPTNIALCLGFTIILSEASQRLFSFIIFFRARNPWSRRECLMDVFHSMQTDQKIKFFFGSYGGLLQGYLVDSNNLRKGVKVGKRIKNSRIYLVHGSFSENLKKSWFWTKPRPSIKRVDYPFGIFVALPTKTWAHCTLEMCYSCENCPQKI